jgi:hypothetical protein
LPSLLRMCCCRCWRLLSLLRTVLLPLAIADALCAVCCCLCWRANCAATVGDC